MTDSNTPQNPFASVRTAHQSENTEDYVELIADTITQKGTAKVSDLSKSLGISKPTVNRTLKRLHKEGFVITEPYKDIILTEKGKALATFCKARHNTVLAFLRHIGVPEHIAIQDAEGIEHHVSLETLKILENHIATTPAKK